MAGPELKINETNVSTMELRRVFERPNRRADSLRSSLGEMSEWPLYRLFLFQSSLKVCLISCNCASEDLYWGGPLIVE